MPVFILWICFIFGRANFIAGDRADRDDIEPSMDTVKLMIDG